MLELSPCPDQVASLDHPDQSDWLLGALFPDYSVVLNFIDELEESLVTDVGWQVMVVH